MECAKACIRFNAVARGVVSRRMYERDPKECLRSLSPMGQISEADETVQAVVYLTEARAN
jgi:hypothetical protein